MLNRVFYTVKRSQPIFKQIRSNQLIQKRFSSDEYVGYREHSYDPDGRWATHVCELVLGYTYAWIMYHFYTDWRHLVGEFIWPNMDWSDEHLGIPPDEED